MNQNVPEMSEMLLATQIYLLFQSVSIHSGIYLAEFSNGLGCSCHARGRARDTSNLDCMGIKLVFTGFISDCP